VHELFAKIGTGTRVSREALQSARGTSDGRPLRDVQFIVSPVPIIHKRDLVYYSWVFVSCRSLMIISLVFHNLLNDEEKKKQRKMTRFYIITPLLLSALLLMGQSSAWTQSQSSSTRAWSSSRRAALLTMDIEAPEDMRRMSVKLQIPNSSSHHPRSLTIPRVHDSVMAAERSHGMPWKKSIASDYTESQLFYMPFWEWQMQFMKDNLTGLRAVPVTSRSGTDMSYVESKDATMRMHTCSFTSAEYKLIRMTVLDAGYTTQVFTSVWYPADSLQPVLGIDLLQFNHAKKHLCIVDFQPVSSIATAASTDDATTSSFEDLLEPIRNQYPSLQGTMTDRFYNQEDSYFSNQMLLGRHNCNDESFSAQSMVFDDLFPAYQQYLATHVNLVRRNNDRDCAEAVAACHAAYDTYSAARDPAHALLARAFGQEWADDYVYDILFPAAAREIAP
jgi:Ferredoxin-dependent bilin reductase